MEAYAPILALGLLAGAFAVFSVTLTTFTGPKRYNRAKMDAYVYLAESIRAWPDQAELAAIIGRSGWKDVEWLNLTGGIVALHRGRR